MKFPHKPENSGSNFEWKHIRRRTIAGCGASSLAVWLPCRRLYPVSTSTLKILVCFLCHNSKGKAKCAIILMDLKAHTKKRISDTDSVPTEASKVARCIRVCREGSIANES